MNAETYAYALAEVLRRQYGYRYMLFNAFDHYGINLWTRHDSRYPVETVWIAHTTLHVFWGANFEHSASIDDPNLAKHVHETIPGTLTQLVTNSKSFIRELTRQPGSLVLVEKLKGVTDVYWYSSGTGFTCHNCETDFPKGTIRAMVHGVNGVLCEDCVFKMKGNEHEQGSTDS